jgi:hypothetical protein
VRTGQSLIRDLKRTTTHVVEKLSDRIFEATARGHMPDVNDLLKEEEIGTPATPSPSNGSGFSRRCSLTLAPLL